MAVITLQQCRRSGRALRRSILAFAMLVPYVAGSPAALHAQGKTVSGVLRDAQNNETLPFATVEVKGTTLRTVTNREGHFVLRSVPPEVVVLRVTTIGYKPTEVELSVAEHTAPLEIKLERMPVEIEGIEALAEIDRMMATGENVNQVSMSPAELAVLPSIGEVDIFRSLQLLPGVSGTNEATAGLFVRGGTPDQNLVLLDGMTVYHVDHFFGFFSAFNANAIKDVQLYKSAYPARYGGRLSSVVDLIGRTGDNQNFHGALGVNLLSAQAVVEVPLFERGSIFFAARRAYTDVLQSSLYQDIFGMLEGGDTSPIGFTPGAGPGRFGNAQVAQTTPDFFFYDLNGKITYNPTIRDLLSISVYSGADNLDRSRDLSRALEGQAGNADLGLVGGLTDLTDWGNLGVSGRWSRQWSPFFYSNALVATSVYYSDYDRRTQTEVRDPDTDSLLRSINFGTVEENRVNDLSFRLDNEWHAAEWHKLDFGGWLTRSAVDYLFVRDDTTTILNLNQNGLEGGVYVQDSWQVLPPLDLNFGIRATYYNNTSQFYIEPRASAIYALSDHVRLMGGYGKHNQFVNRVINENVTEGSRDFWLLAGDEVPVSSAQHYTFGAAYENSRYLFDAELYHKDFEGLSEFTLRFTRETGVEFDNLFFEGTGYSQGLELLAQKKVGLYSGWVSYTYSRVRYEFPGFNEGEPFPALQDQPHEVNLVGNFNPGRWTVSGTWVYSTGRPYTSPESTYNLDLLDGTQQSYIHVGEKNGQRLPDYHRLDLAAHYRFDLGRAWHGDVGLSVFNALNRQNVWYREFDLSVSPPLITDVTYLGRTISLSVRIAG